MFPAVFFVTLTTENIDMLAQTQASSCLGEQANIEQAGNVG